MQQLEQKLLQAHSTGDTRSLITLYQQAASATPDQEAANFYLTHAWVFALESGSPLAADIYQMLQKRGCA